MSSEPEATQICTTCRQALPLTAFAAAIRRSGVVSYRKTCRACINTRQLAQYRQYTMTRPASALASQKEPAFIEARRAILAERRQAQIERARALRAQQKQAQQADAQDALAASPTSQLPADCYTHCND